MLVAPFMKAATLKRIVKDLNPLVPLHCLTRWRMEEIAVGVSDLECWDIISERKNSRFMLLPNLHTKYYRFDGIAFLGSANITMAALGWSTSSNTEALARFCIDDVDTCKKFERDLLTLAVDVTPELVSDFKEMMENFSAADTMRWGGGGQEQEIVQADEGHGSRLAFWLPRSRSPEFLYDAYSGQVDAISRDGLLALRKDLLDFDLPPGLEKTVFLNLVQSRLVSSPIIIKLDQFLTVKRRFGEIRTWLAAQLEVRDAKDEWQRLMRWLLEFLSHRYTTNTPNYSEIFGRK